MERDARRKKIASQEMDRMAIITGRDYTPDPNNISESFNPTNEDGSLFQDYLQDDVPNTMKMDDTDEKEGAVLSLQPSVQSDNANLPYKPFEYHLSSISPKEINFSIISSENTRVVCSFVIAVLVVLSHINLPHHVVESNSLIAYRPLYALLLTDTLIVAARLALYSEEKEDDNEVKFEGGNNNWDGAVKLLEWGLVLHQTVRAVFIDCSFYVAIVVCGLSMV
ncbi:hypothetical protein CASFOL_024851 [Castilleja foliolosa]|uniref:Uncharacterized protein n=1 Tax=Castilleja foliolosa TaxID=1961234 RepID=A0ABD3CQY0_9LAMI